MNTNKMRVACWFAAVFMLLIVLFSAMAIIQAGSIYVGERALSNLRFWGSIMALSFVGMIVFGFFAVRLGRSASRPSTAI